MNKADLLGYLNEQIDLKIAEFENLIADVRSSNNDTKSSMGDKYETSREMLQQEINRLQSQLKVQLDQKAALSKISSEPCDIVKNGAIVQTKYAYFFVSVGFGEIILEGQKIFAVSPEAPLIQAIWGFSSGSQFVFNGVSQEILAIY
ncbi:hypothetical protein [Moheibacter stercoris]|uniref:Transcription elongation factor, GreA/GreB, C-term n=1 Tax=Moheibacter stercoris TaxID=1628251 RepID=A0ABV2LVM2_9FLAO